MLVLQLYFCYGLSHFVAVTFIYITTCAGSVLLASSAICLAVRQGHLWRQYH